MKLTNIKPIHVTGFFGDYVGYSHSFHKRMVFLLRASFEEAIDNDFCVKNPAKKIKPKGVMPEEKTVFSAEQVKQILKFAETDELFGIPVYILFNTRIRSGEMRALTGNKFDFENCILRVDQAVKRGGELGLPKHDKKRIVTLEPEVVEYLSTRINRNDRYIIGDNHYVTKSGFEGRYRNFAARLNKYLANIGAEPIDMETAHKVRHTVSTLWQANGMSRELAGELLGHGCVEVTNGYTHTQLKTLQEVVRKCGIARNLE